MEKLNVEETLELQYFHKIQIQKLEIRALKTKIGGLTAEIDHLNYLLERAHEPASNAKKWKRKHDDLMYSHIELTRKYNDLYRNGK